MFPRPVKDRFCRKIKTVATATVFFATMMAEQIMKVRRI